jgi:hypothetical protein
MSVLAHLSAGGPVKCRRCRRGSAGEQRGWPAERQKCESWRSGRMALGVRTAVCSTLLVKKFAWGSV